MSEERQDVQTYGVKVPHIEYNKPPVPYVGTIKFVMIPTIDTTKLIQKDGLYNVDIDSDDFDGWVFPNGFKYKRSEVEDRFKTLESIEMFNYIQDELYLCLPCLSNYFKLNPKTEELDSVKKVNFKNSVPSHSHKVKTLDVSGKIKVVEG